jgi:hypothetical protein
MDINTPQLHSSMNSAEKTIVALMRALVDKHPGEWFQAEIAGPKQDLVSLNQGTDSQGVTRCYGYFAFVVNTSLSTVPKREWEKIIPLSDATIPPGFYNT